MGANKRYIDQHVPHVAALLKEDCADVIRGAQTIVVGALLPDAVDALKSYGWNDRISSLRVISGRWQVCRHNDYRDCREVGGGEREPPRDWNDAISSLRPLRPFSDD